MTKTYRVSRINAEEANLNHRPVRTSQDATEENVNEVRQAMRAQIEPGSSDWITVQEI